MDVQDQNWQHFCANHMQDWYGIWTRYSPQGEVLESFQSLRSFRCNPQQTEIYQVNRYKYADGRTQEKHWQYNPGIIKSFFFEQGGVVAAEKQLEPNLPFVVEFLFQHEQLRNSAIAVYNQSGSLSRTASVREDATGFPSQYWSGELNLLPERHINGNWQGTSMTMTPDLQVSTAISTQQQFSREGNQSVFFPDEISLFYPEKICIGESFTILANWLVAPSYLQQMSVKYDESGALLGVTLELLHKLETEG